METLQPVLQHNVHSHRADTSLHPSWSQSSCQSQCFCLQVSQCLLFSRWRKLKDGIRLLACKCSPYNYPAHSFSGLRNDENELGLGYLLQRAAAWHHSLGVVDHRLSVSSCKGLPQKTSTGQPPHHSPCIIPAATISGSGHQSPQILNLWQSGCCVSAPSLALSSYPHKETQKK